MILNQELDGTYLVQCTCGHIYHSSLFKNSVPKHGEVYPRCKMCGKTEGVANMKVPIASKLSQFDSFQIEEFWEQE